MAEPQTNDAPTAVLTVGVLMEAVPERRVALDPDTASRLAGSGFGVRVQRGAGLEAGFSDQQYQAVGAVLTDRDSVLRCDVLAVVHPPEDGADARLTPGQVVLGLLEPLTKPERIGRLAAAGVTAVAFETVPRTLSRAQQLDALTSQASAAGYRAAVLAAAAAQSFFPMMMTAAGTVRPARVLVIGAGIAGLQAIATAKRLGAVVSGYDVRAAARGEVESLGAQFLTSKITGEGEGGYARTLTAEEQSEQRQELIDRLPDFDAIITTAQVPGGRPPLLVPADAVAALSPGTVCVDLGAGPLGGNVAGSKDGQRLVTSNGAVIVGAGDAASGLPRSASQMYARNVAAMLHSIVADGRIAVDPADELHAAIVVCHAGRVVHPAVRAALGLADDVGDETTEPMTDDDKKEAQRA